MDINDIYSVLEYCMLNGGALRMDYINNKGERKTRVVEPHEWDNKYVFKAFCHLTQEERNFKVRSIMEWQVFSSAQEALAYDENPPEDSPIPPSAIPMPSHTLRQQTKTQTTRLEPFSQIGSSDNWSRLVSYYKECLDRENRQQFILDPQGLRTFPWERERIKKFLIGEIKLVFENRSHLRQDPVARFIDSKRNDPSKKLCLGYPFLVFDTGKIAPLIFVPVEINATDDAFTLQPEEYDISYAALKILQMEDEEIEAFLSEFGQLKSNSQENEIGDLEELFLRKINEIYKEDLRKTEEPFIPGTIFNGPALFWVNDNTATINLIRELGELAGQGIWERSSDSLKQLLTTLPEHEYPPTQSWDQDEGIFITPINDHQLRAIRAVRSEPVVIVTGPPGTGKSQLVLNLIAEAFLKGERVLLPATITGQWML
jgi:hypothetical protein